VPHAAATTMPAVTPGVSTSIADIQDKYVTKLAAKLPSGGNISARTLSKSLGEFDGDNDGFISLSEFLRAVERAGNALDRNEAEFLFAFWDTYAGEREPRGVVDVKMAVDDLVRSLPRFSTGFNSGNDSGLKAGGNKSNKSSMEGGIFGGGSYEADSRGAVPPASHRGAAPPGYQMEQGGPGQMSNRPRGNQSSVAGGIFGNDESSAPKASGGGNKSNLSSIPGGIFGENNAMAPPPSHRCNSNASSIPGGIFGN